MDCFSLLEIIFDAFKKKKKKGKKKKKKKKKVLAI